MPDSTTPAISLIPTPSRNMTAASPADWLTARQALAEEETALDQQRNAVMLKRLSLPRLKIEKAYVLETPQGKKSLGDLFDGRSQLLVYHFMFGPEWEQGCHGCSFFADGFDGTLAHLNNHDVTLTCVSRAPLAKIEAYKQRMGWHFPWASSFGSDFNFDFHVSFTKEELAGETVEFNYKRIPVAEAHDELPGMSAFQKDADGSIYLTYGNFGTGTDDGLTTMMLLDMAPKGRNEQKMMDFVKRHDEYAQTKPKSAHNCCA